MMHENGDMLQHFADLARAKKTGKPYVDRGSWDYNPKTDKVEPGYHLKIEKTRKKKNESRAEKILETITLMTPVDRPRFQSTRNGVPTSKDNNKVEPAEEIPWGRKKRQKEEK